MASSFGGPDAASREVTQAFWAALNLGDADGAQEALVSLEYQDDGVRFPIVQNLIDEGEWDVQVPTKLVCLEKPFCTGWVGTGGTRFCGRPSGSCSIGGHATGGATVPSGWFIAVGGLAQGHYCEPCLPLVEDGGPIQSAGAGLLADGDTFRLSRGQWRYLIQLWAEGPLARSISAGSGGGAGEHKSPESQDSPVRVRGLLDDPEDAYDNDGDDDDHDGGADALSGLRARLFETEEALERYDRLFTEWTNRYSSEVRARLQSSERQEREVTLLKQEINALRIHCDSIGRGAAVAPQASAVPVAVLEKLERCSQALFNPQGIVPRIALQFKAFKERIESGGGVECHGIKFTSKRETLAWYKQRDISTPSVFFDAFAMLHSVTETIVDVAEHSKQKKVRVENKYDSVYAETLEASFGTNIPRGFLGGKTVDVRKGPHAMLKTHLPTYNVWCPTSTLDMGVGQQLEDGVTQFAEQFEDHRETLEEHDQVSKLASAIATDSLQFCLALIQFIDAQQKTLTNDTNYSPDQVWEMQLECLRKILEELSNVRRAVVASADKEPGYYLWGILQAWQVQQRYRKNHFKDDPALTGVLIRRVLLQAGKDNFKDKLGKWEKLADQFSEHMKNTNSQIKSIQTKMDKIKQ